MKRAIKRGSILIACLLLAGCAASDGTAGPATRPAILSAPAKEATTVYWYKQPPVASVTSPDFQKLWDACRNTLVNDEFDIDQENYRGGVLTTWPMISKQFFEFWRSDAGSVHEIVHDSLATIRRTARFEFARQADGTYIAWPKVVKEQSSHPERRITVQAQFTSAFSSAGEPSTHLNDEGESVTSRYWYCFGRDEAMEKELANSVREKLAH